MVGCCALYLTLNNVRSLLEGKVTLATVPQSSSAMSVERESEREEGEEGGYVLARGEGCCDGLLLLLRLSLQLLVPI
jgi:hypothetical protein